MKKKVAIFVDWDNLRKDIAKIQNYSKYTDKQSIIDFQKNFDYNNSSHIIKLIEAFLENDEEIYRIFFYTAKPKNIDEIPDVYKTEQEKNYYRKYEEKINDFLDRIAIEPYIALRLGIIKYGDKLLSNGRLDAKQKQVDMLIGLDIAHVSYQKLADKVILFSKDSDMKPVLKVARTNGLMTIIPTLKESRHPVNYLLKLHSDLIREKSITEVLNSLKNEVFLLGN
ncbi:MAG: NYN domain-containing protein [Campylobacter sp.]|nr:NYN domain-containing protein [Campylobacter sp.]